MFSLVGTVALIVFFVVRPQEIFPALQAISITHLMLVGLVGLAIDIRIKRVQIPRSRLAKIILLFISWSIFTELLQIRNGVTVGMWIALISSYWLFFLIALGAQSMRSLRVVSWALFASIMFATVIAVHQGTQPQVCVIATAEAHKPAPGPQQLCETRRDCEITLDLDAETDFVCERVGLAGTTSIFGRVKYRGLLEDPNELAWVANMAFPLFLWLIERWRKPIKIPAILIVFAIDVTCVIMTKSRSGQQSFLVMVIVLTWRRLGIKGIIAAGILGLPVLMLGGRDGAGAESSSIERLGCWGAGLEIWAHHPIFGVGPWRFMEFHRLTAHNSYILTLAEGGPILLFAWTAMFWQAFRTQTVTRRELDALPGAQEPAVLAGMLNGTAAATVLSALFLSIAYKPALWAYLGIVLAYETTVYQRLGKPAPEAGPRDNIAIVAFGFTLMVAIKIYVRMKGITW